MIVMPNADYQSAYTARDMGNMVDRKLLRQLLCAVILSICCALASGGQPVNAQSNPQHTLHVEGEGFSIVQVEVDGSLRFQGILSPHEVRHWRGEHITLTIESNLPIALTFDGILQGAIQQAGEKVTVRWPLRTPMVFAAEERPPQYYTVVAGDTLFVIAQQFGLDVETLMVANQLSSSDLIYAGTTLAIPGSNGTLPSRPLYGEFIGGEFIGGDEATTPVTRAPVAERLTAAAQAAPTDSPFYQKSWLSYYGRPAVPVMGILGEYELDELTTLLKAEAARYDEANGDDLALLPAFHLVYGMASRAPNADGSHLIFLEDALVEEYIVRAQKEGFAVILDIQIGALSPTDALAYGLPWLAYENVHLALDPEFAMAHPGQQSPGDPIGYVTAAQVNQAQQSMQTYMEENAIAGQRVLLIHQFLETMIENRADLDWTFERLALTIVADGWGGPWGKISKYNAFMDAETRFTAFKLFYRWDEPLMTPRETLGIDGYGEGGYIEVTPNLVIYQ